MLSSCLEVELPVGSCCDDMEQDDEATKNQNAVANEAVMVPKAVLQILSNGHSLALEVCDDLIGIVDVVEVCQLTGHQSIDLQAQTVSSAPECQAIEWQSTMLCA